MAEVERSLKISSDYTERLTDTTLVPNLKPTAAESLLGNYPSHGFVIDRKEAKGLFRRVEEPDDQLIEIAVAAEKLIPYSLVRLNPYASFISTEHDDSDKTTTNDSAEREDPGNDTDIGQDSEGAAKRE